MSFEPFAVQCLTCGSRLRVTDPAVVGTIAACPRCHSMVQIAGPQNQVAVGGSDVDSQAITEDAIAAPDVASGDGQPPSGFSGSQEVDPDLEDENGGSLPPPQWQSARTHRSRQIALVAAVSIAGLLAAILLFSWFVLHWGRSTPVAQSDPKVQDSPATTSSVTADDIDASDEPDPEQQAASESVDRQQATEETAGSAERAADSSDDRDQAEVETVERTAPAGAAVEGRPKPDEASAAADASNGPAVPPTDLMPSSPIIGGSSSPETSEAAETGGQMTELPPGLAEYSVFLEPAGPVDLKPTTDAPPTLEDMDIEAASREEIDPMLATAAAPTIDLRSDLAIPVAIDAKRYSPADLTLLLTQITTVPIQLDWVSFDLLGIDLHQPIEVPRTALVPAADLLEVIADSMRSEIRPQRSYLELTPTDEAFEQRVGEIATLADFGSGRESAAATLNEFLQAVPDETEELAIGPDRREQQLAMLAVDSLRRMRGIKPRIPDALFAHWAQVDEDDSVEWPVLSGGRSGDQRRTPISVTDLIRQLSQLNGASCVVQWMDVTRRQLSPTELLIPHSEQDAATILDSILADYGLHARQVDGQHWWIGTAATYDRAKVLVWTGPLDDANGQVLEQRIASVMQGRDDFRFARDRDSGRALMMLPRYIVRQLPKIDTSVAAK